MTSVVRAFTVIARALAPVAIFFVDVKFSPLTYMAIYGIMSWLSRE